MDVVLDCKHKQTLLVGMCMRIPFTQVDARRGDPWVALPVLAMEYCFTTSGWMTGIPLKGSSIPVPLVATSLSGPVVVSGRKYPHNVGLLSEAE